MKLLMMPNLDKKDICACVQAIYEFSLSHSMELLMNERYGSAFPSCPGIRQGEFFSLLNEADLCLAVGGDGTMIHMAKHAAKAGKPVLGVNLGRLGFLATLESSELPLLDRLFTKEYQIEERMLLEATLRQGGETRRFEALNDAVVSKGALSRMVEVNLSNRGRQVGVYRADGVIFATPTGSTAYSLSAGGPMIDPGLSGILLTPISAHSLFSRSIFFSDDSELTLTPAGSEEQEIFLTVDGEEAVPLPQGSELTIKKSGLAVHLINLTGKAFYEVINEKLVFRAHS
ncbi:MAG: NAD(+)/NADH kinase [Oscillospiraceae bacterium]|nr:NAD(+)/NADH kinase [Oscillospiraceae bacterium]